MYTIQQDSANKLVIPFNGTDYDFLLIVFTYSCYESVGVFENTAGTGCDYEIVVNEVGSEGTANPENGDVKISPRSTWVGEVYGQDDNVNLFPQYAALIDNYKFQVKGDSCKVYPNLSPKIDCLPATAIVQDQDGNELARENIASGETGVIPVNVVGGVLYTYPYDSFNTGQDVSYATGDDKWVRDNVFIPEISAQEASGLLLVYPRLSQTDPTKLVWGSNPDGSGNNIFGNLERFTDTLGTQVYTNGLVIDHLTGLMLTVNVNLNTRDWLNTLDFFNNLSFADYNDWHTGNYNEYESIALREFQGLNYSPFNYSIVNDGSTGSDPIYTSSTNKLLTSSASRYFNNYDQNINGFASPYRFLGRTKSQVSVTGFGFRKAFTYNPTTKQMELT